MPARSVPDVPGAPVATAGRALSARLSQPPGPHRVARLLSASALAAGVVLVSGSCSAGGTPEPTARSTSATADVAPTPSESLLPSPTATGSEVGALAPGFPSGLVSPPEGSEILVSSVKPDPTTGLTLISLNLRSPLGTADVVQEVRDQLLAAGFVETVLDPGQAGLAASSTFVRGDGGEELLSLGVLDRDGVRTLTLGGTVRL